MLDLREVIKLKKNVKIEIRLTEDEKEFIVNKGKEEGFTSTTAFIKASTKKYLSLTVDTSDYLDVLNETRKIGRNINSMIRDIRYNNVISEKDIITMESSLINIEKILKKDKKEFDELENKFEKLSSKDLVEAIKNHNMQIPLLMIYDNIIEMIKDNLLYIINIMKRNKWESHTMEFLYRFMYDLLPDKYDEIHISKINNDIYKYTLSIKNKLIKDTNKYTEQDYIDLMNIIEFHEMKRRSLNN